MNEAAQTALLKLVGGYKRFLSPLFPPACRFVPTCSEYAAEAVTRYGILRGSGMALLRLLRCHPLVRGGFDPVPIPDPALTGNSQRRASRIVRALAANHD